jgi:hypothetical protein
MALLRSMPSYSRRLPFDAWARRCNGGRAHSRSLDCMPKSRKVAYETFQYLGSMKRFSKERVVESDSLLNRSNLDKGGP